MKKTLFVAALALVSVFAFAKPQGVTFGTEFGADFVSAVQEASEGNPEQLEFTIQDVTLKRLSATAKMVDGKSSSVIACQYLTFKSASAGDAVLHIKARIARAVNEKGKAIVVYKNGQKIDSTTMKNFDTEKTRTGSFDIAVPGVEKGDEIKIVCEASRYHRIFGFSWNKAE